MNIRTPFFVLLTSIVTVLIGLALAGLGTWLVLLGGSPYYLLAGLGLLVCGVLLGLRRYVGAWVYTAVLVATAVWAVWEVGLDGWSLIPASLRRLCSASGSGRLGSPAASDPPVAAGLGSGQLSDFRWP